MMTELSLRMKNRRAALGAPFHKLRPAEDAVELLLQNVGEVTTFWTKTVAVAALSFFGHRYSPFQTSKKAEFSMPCGNPGQGRRSR
jgi:hypothetical protein